MAAPALRGLLVDYGGVLTTNVFTSFTAFCTREGLPEDQVRTLFRTDAAARELLVGVEEGTLAEEVFEERLAALLGVRPLGLIKRMFSGAGPDEPMLAAVRAARRQGIRTGLISNSWGLSGYDRALLAELFDGVVISGEVGVRKPAKEIYVLGALAVDLDPTLCVYVDDLPGNLEPARDLGMTVLHHTDAEESIPTLERLLALPLTNGG
jgi:epoxide hydrolase-like predicted phosphatase